ncbi:type II secretion system GspH family protein [Patescibacteria group bacterium]|nr:type II secretion system GspH family protein [Patescibacteria group bacterium]
MRQNGFTLVELMITVMVIVVLTSTGFVAYSIVLKQGRDSKRQSDLRTIQSALEQYYADQGFYPITSDNATGGEGLDTLLGNTAPPAFTSGIGLYSPPPAPAPPLKTYLNSLPKDTGTSRYFYGAIPSDCDNAASATRCTSYCLYAKLDNPPSPVPDAPTGCSYPSGYNFALTPP